MTIENTTQSPTTQAPEIIAVDADCDEVCCDGGGGSLGHPMVWYTFDGRKTVECMYCDRQFEQKSA